MHMLRLRTLGSVDLRSGDGRELRAVLTQPRRLALLVYLTLAIPRAFQRRDTLLALFWADQSLDRARASLSRAIYFLRQQLGPDALISRGDEEIGLHPERVWCDAVAFADALHGRRFREALAWYGGDLLPGLFAPDAAGFEDWLEQERARLREQAAAGAREQAALEEQAGNLSAAVEWARWSVERTPFSEVALRRLLVLLDRSGDRADAERAYQRFAGRMASEFDLAPSPETDALMQAIRSRHRSADSVSLTLPQPVPSSSPANPAPSIGSVGTQSSTTIVRPRGRRRWLAAPAALAGVILYALWLWLPSKPDQVHVAPFEFDRADPALAVRGKLAEQQIVGMLAATGLVRIAAGANALRAAIVVEGSLTAEQERIRVEVRISRGRTRQIVWAVRPPPIIPGDFETRIGELGRRIAGGVVALGMPRFAGWFPVASGPPDLEAFLEFAQADLLQARGADRAALPHLERARARDPDFFWAELQLISAYLSLFDSQGANPLIEAVSSRRERLNLLQRHWLDWMVAVHAEDLIAAYTALSAAAELAPERFLYDQARWATFLNRPRETITLLEKLGPGSPYNGGTPGYWRHLTRSYHALEKFESELAVARQARRYPVAPIVVRSFEAIALAALGRTVELRALLDTVLALPDDRGTSPRQLMAESGTTPAQLMVLVAEELRAHGHERDAGEFLDRASVWYAGQPPGTATDRSRRFDLGMAAYYARNWARADTIFRRLLAEDPDNFVYLGRMGTVAARQGDQATAREILRRFDGFRGTLPMPHTSVGYWQAKITMLLGDHRRALLLMTEAVGPQGRGGMHADFDFERIWSTREFRDFVRPKG